MLVIISDLHLTDGSSGHTIPPRAFKVFRQRLRDLAYDASWRLKDGGPRYKPVTEMDVILLGDVLDVIRSRTWLKEDVRPWHAHDEGKAGALAGLVGGITDDILSENEESLGVFSGMAGGDAPDQWITVPPGDGKGGVSAAAGWDPTASGRVRVKVNVHYMVGNHDWLYHLPGPQYDRIRGRVSRAMGLANEPARPFPHDPGESTSIAGVLDAHRVFARHGDIFDSFNYDDGRGRDASSLGDAIVIELLNRFHQEIAADRSIPGDVQRDMAELDNVRPLLLIPMWINGVLRRSTADPAEERHIKGLWDGLVDAFLKDPFVRSLDRRWAWDDVDRIGLLLKFSKGIALRTVSQAIRAINRLFGSDRTTYWRNAVAETEFKNRRARFIVYGHTHYEEVVPLDVSQPRSRPEVRQIYVNTGTWRRVHQLARHQPQQEEFVDWNVMTYAAFFREGERKDRPFEVWAGSLGV